MRRFVFGLFFHHGVRGWYRAGMDLIEELLESTPEDPHDDDDAIVRAAVTAERGRYLAMLGQPELTLDLTSRAVATLAELPDRFLHLLAIEAHCDGLAFANDWEEIHNVNSAGILIAEESGYEWWQAGLLTWRGMAATMQGNEEQGAADLEEGADRLSRLKDDYFTVWNLISRAMVARWSEQPLDAVELFRRVIEHSRSIGFGQTLQVGLQSVGEVSLEIDEFAEADEAFMEALAMAEDSGMVGSMAFSMIRVAETKVAMGNHELGVEVLASVLADPVSGQRIPTQEMAIGEDASKVLARLEADMGPDVYQAAYARGEARSLDVTAKELLTGSV